MDEASLYRLLEDFQDGSVSADEVVRRIRRLPYADLGFARVDHHRSLRQGLPEAIYGPGKSVDHCVAIVGELLSEPDGGPVVLSRASADQSAAALAAHPGGEQSGTTVVWRPAAPRGEPVAVFAAGTADLPVAEECTATLRALGFQPDVVTDCGVAGVHRLFEHTSLLMTAQAVVVIAGMEGALASLVGGLTPAPVIAVPTSTGYGASLEGVTALLAMLASCAPGLCVVGIDNGFGAAWAVARILGRPQQAVQEAGRQTGQGQPVLAASGRDSVAVTR
jgi:pyridinium-3,5-biscarboxylic acid mononucleotide synthase